MAKKPSPVDPLLIDFVRALARSDAKRDSAAVVGKNMPSPLSTQKRSRKKSDETIYAARWAAAGGELPLRRERRFVDRLPKLPFDAAYFVVLFSRFDYAAKRSEWVGGGNSLLIDWKKVGGAFGEDFFDHVQRSGQAKYLINNPPRKLVRGGVKGVVFPHPLPPALTDVQSLFEAVGLVRNNLFHGEKIGWSHRDQLLVADATTVLEEAWIWAEKNHMPLAQHMEYSHGGTP